MSYLTHARKSLNAIAFSCKLTVLPLAVFCEGIYLFCWWLIGFQYCCVDQGPHRRQSWLWNAARGRQMKFVPIEPWLWLGIVISGLYMIGHPGYTLTFYALMAFSMCAYGALFFRDKKRRSGDDEGDNGGGDDGGGPSLPPPSKPTHGRELTFSADDQAEPKGAPPEGAII